MNSVGKNERVQKPARIPPAPSCGRDRSRGRANPYPQSIVSPCRVHSDFFFGIFRKIHSNFVQYTSPMTIKTEFPNFLAGIILVSSGVLNLIFHHFELGMNWIIFGSMYLVMDDYLQNKTLDTLLERVTDTSRQLFSWVGLIGSMIIFIYYI